MCTHKSLQQNSFHLGDITSYNLVVKSHLLPLHVYTSFELYLTVPCQEFGWDKRASKCVIGPEFSLDFMIEHSTLQYKYLAYVTGPVEHTSYCEIGLFPQQS